MNDRERILESLEPLFQEAEEKGLWFYTEYQSLWFSPKELRKQHEKGRFLLSPVSWRLRAPYVRLIELEDSIACAKEAHAIFKRRMGES